MPILHSFGLIGENVRLSRVVLLGSACVAGGVALLWYLRRNPKKAGDITEKAPHTDSTPLKSSLDSERIATSKKLKERGNEFFKAGKYESALEAFTEAIAMCPSNETQHLAVCYQNRAATYDRLSKTEKSIEDCTEAIRLDKFYLKAIVRRGKAQKLLQHYQEAMDDFAYASSVDQNGSCNLSLEMSEVINHLAIPVLNEFKEGRGPIPIRDESVLLWRSCFVNDPVLKDLSNPCISTENYYKRALEAVRERRYEEVISLLERELPLLSEPSDILRDCVFIARFALMKEDAERIQVYLDKIDQLWESLSEDAKKQLVNRRYRAIYYLLLAAVNLERINDSSFDAAIELDDHDVDVYVGASMLFSENLDFAAAIKYLDRLAEIDPNHHLVKHMKANCHLAMAISQGDVCDTLRCIHDVHQLLVDNSHAHPILHLITGRLYYAAQNKELARASFEKAAEALPQYSAPLYHLAMLEAEDLEGSSERLSLLEAKMKRCLQVEATNPDALAVLAKIAVQRDAFRDALDLYKQYLSQCPLRYNRTAVLPVIINYIQLNSLCKALDNLAAH